MFESVHTDGRTHGWTPARLVYYKLTSEPSAQVSLKCIVDEAEEQKEEEEGKWNKKNV